MPKTKIHLVYLPNESFIMDLPETDKNLVGIFVHLIIMVVFMKVTLNEGSATIHYLTESSKLKQKIVACCSIFLFWREGYLLF